MPGHPDLRPDERELPAARVEDRQPGVLAMSNEKKRSRKLALRREFLRRLTPAALDRVVGGTDTLIEADDVDPGPCTPLNESCCLVLSYGAPPRTRGC